MLRKRRPDPTPVLGGRWGAAVQRAEDQQRRFLEVIGRLPAGPMLEQLDAVRDELARAVAAVAAAAARADALDATLGAIDPDQLSRDLKEARRELARAEDDGRVSDALSERVASLDRQLGAAHRVWDAVDAAATELDARLVALGEVVAFAAVIVTHPVHEVAVEVDGMVRQLSSLAEALDELARP